MRLKFFFQIIVLLFLIIVSFCLGYCFKDSHSTYMSLNRIDIEEQKCIDLSNVIDYPLCSKQAEIAWDKKIQKNYEQLKSIMTKEDFKYIQTMNSSWNETVLAEIDAVNKFIYNKDGTIYQTLGSSKIADLKKQYAILLYSIYENYNEEKNGIKF